MVMVRGVGVHADDDAQTHPEEVAVVSAENMVHVRKGPPGLS
jgi:hypothetical protein